MFDTTVNLCHDCAVTLHYGVEHSPQRWIGEVVRAFDKDFGPFSWVQDVIVMEGFECPCCEREIVGNTASEFQSYSQAATA